MRASLPTVEEIRDVLLDRMTNGNEPPSALSLARAVYASLLQRALADEDPCFDESCPNPALPGLDGCAEHVTQRIADLRRQLHETDSD